MQPDVLQSATVLEGRYRVGRLIGEGGMSQVYEGEHLMIGRRVAIKCLRADVAADADALARLHREALAATSIGNAHIIEVTDMGRLPDGGAFLVLELLEGRSLADELARGGQQPLGRVVHLITQLCDALGAAHGRGIVHRDLKPGNVILVPRDGDPDFVKLLDFGIAKVKESPHAQKLTRTGLALGTPLYMAPEQLQDPAAADHRADLYALGVMMYEALCGVCPFTGGSLIALAAQIVNAAPPPLSQHRRDLPPELERIVGRLLAKAPADRFQDTVSVAAALAPYRAPEATRPGGPLGPVGVPWTAPGRAQLSPTVPVVGAPPLPPTVAQGRRPRRVALLAALAAIPALLFVAVAVFFGVDRDDGRPVDLPRPPVEVRPPPTVAPPIAPAPPPLPVEDPVLQAALDESVRRCLNPFSRAIAQSRLRYFVWCRCSPATEPSPGPRPLPSIEIPATSTCVSVSQVTPRSGLEGTTLLDATVAYAAAASDVKARLAQTEALSEGRSPFGGAESRATLHRSLVASLAAFDAAERTLVEQVDRLREEEDGRAFERCAREGRQTLDCDVLAVMRASRRIVELGLVPGGVAAVDAAALDDAIGTLDRALEAMALRAASNPPEADRYVTPTNLTRAGRSYAGAARELSARAREGRPFTALERAALDTPEERDIAGSPGKLAAEYDELVWAYNTSNPDRDPRRVLNVPATLEPFH